MKVSHHMRSQDRRPGTPSSGSSAVYRPGTLQTALFSSDHYHSDQVSYPERTTTILHFHLNTSLPHLREPIPVHGKVSPPGQKLRGLQGLKEVPEFLLGNKNKQSRLIMQEKCI